MSNGEPAGAAGTGAGPDEATWRRLVHGVLRDPSQLQLTFQPIVGLQEAKIVGYEALSRFPSYPQLTPDQWFAAADRHGVGAALEAVALRQCLIIRASLPTNCFLTVNVSPHLLVDSELSEVLLAAGDLRPMVVELTEHHDADDLHPLLVLRDKLVTQGALLALDDAGSGYSGLKQMTYVRPHMIKLDRALVEDADSDEVKLALAELLGEFGGRLDAWLLAEGIETWAECEAFLRLRVPLGQGYLLGRPAPPWAKLDTAVAQRLTHAAAQTRVRDQAASLVDAVASDDETPVQPG